MYVQYFFCVSKALALIAVGKSKLKTFSNVFNLKKILIPLLTPALKAQAGFPFGNKQSIAIKYAVIKDKINLKVNFRSNYKR